MTSELMELGLKLSPSRVRITISLGPLRMRFRIPGDHRIAGSPPPSGRLRKQQSRVDATITIGMRLYVFLALLLPLFWPIGGFASQRLIPARWTALLRASIDSIACNTGTIPVTRVLNGTEHSYQLAYRFYRPMSLSSRKAAPIVVLHGGPSLPSDYLYPLVEHVPYRSVLFYDQLGCGESDEPEDTNAYSIELALDDLDRLLRKLGVRRFHLYGQSYGGILAFEYLRRLAEQGDKQSEDEGCLSAILSSSPTSVAVVEKEAQRLLLELPSPEQFRSTHQCRTKDMPKPLQAAYAKAGTVWRGTAAIAGYQATAPSNEASKMPSCLEMRGEYDFVTELCVQDWSELWNGRVRQRVLAGCSHHGLLENGREYGEIVDSFFCECD